VLSKVNYGVYCQEHLKVPAHLVWGVDGHCWIIRSFIRCIHTALASGSVRCHLFLSPPRSASSSLFSSLLFPLLVDALFLFAVVFSVYLRPGLGLAPACAHHHKQQHKQPPRHRLADAASNLPPPASTTISSSMSSHQHTVSLEQHPPCPVVAVADAAAVTVVVVPLLPLLMVRGGGCC
jgi:hypothetical protein